MVAGRFGDVDCLLDSYLSQPSPIRSRSPTCDFDDTHRSSTSSEDDKPKKRSSKNATLSERKERRRAQNRRAAATSRAKKRKYHESLEDQVAVLEDKNLTLQQQLDLLREENHRLLKCQRASETPTKETCPIMPIKDTTTPEPTTDFFSFSTTSELAPASFSSEQTIAYQSAVLNFPQQSEAMVMMMLMLAHGALINYALLNLFLRISHFHSAGEKALEPFQILTSPASTSPAISRATCTSNPTSSTSTPTEAEFSCPQIACNCKPPLKPG